jgi:murein DD-endopeptidase MepM/ murein hydrolase activator NlpD
MRSSLHRGLLAKALLTVATAALLAGCSNSIERFQSAYNNPSDADPVYTASVPKPKKAAKPRIIKPDYEEPSYDAASNDIIEETPVKRAAIPMAKPKDYASAYTPAYKQPKLVKKPKLVIPQEEEIVAVEPAEEEVAPVAVRAPFKKAAAAKPKLEAPVEEDIAMVDEPVAPKKKIKFNAPKPVVEEQAAEAEVEAPTPVKAKGVHTVENGETLYSLGRKYGVSPFAIAEANGLDRDKQLSLGQQVKIPGGKIVKAKPVAEPEEQVVDAEPVKKVKRIAERVEPEDQVADAEPVVKEKPAKKKKAPLSLAEEEQVAEDTSTDAEPAIGEAPKKKVIAEAKPKIKEQAVAETPVSPAGLDLRWPLKGKVISGFGNKPGGLKNEGINISVPEGTSIRAADGGVVAYAGNELKGYGNLVLIRHPGGYVTAYAHAKELHVKRGDKVERGAVIGKAGQTGSVSSPQLHFEVRKGATALDPMRYMSSATAAN